MQISIMETAFPDLERAEAAVQAVQAGAAGVELVLRDDRALGALAEPARLDALRDQLRDAGAAVSSVALLCNTATDGLIRRTDATAPAVELVRGAVDLAAALEAPVVLLPFFGKAEIAGEQELNTAGDILLELGEQADEAGVTLGVESMLPTRDKLYLYDHTGGVGVANYLDVGNTVLRKLDPATEVRDLGAERICMVHFKDVRTREGEPPEQKLRLGEGQVHFESAAQALHAIGYDGWITLETPPLDDAATTAKANVAFAKKVLGL